MDCVIAIDLGTSSVRASAHDASASVIPNCSVVVPLSFQYTKDGGAFGDPVEIARSVEACIDQILDLCHYQKLKVIAVGIDVIAGAYVGMDDNYQAATDLFTYAETRAFQQATVLRKQSISSFDIQKTGVPVHSAYFPSIYKWLKDSHYLSKDPVLWTDIGGFLFNRWFGCPSYLSFSIASWMGLMDRSTGTINRELLEVLNLSPDTFPELKPYDQALAGLSEGFAKRWPILEQVPFLLPVGDGAAATIGSGCTSDQRTALTIGTTGSIRMFVEGHNVYVPEGLWSYRLSNNSLIGGSLNDGGTLLSWAMSHLRIPSDHQVLDQQLFGLMPNGHGLTSLPFLTGERSPGWAVNARATISGMRIDTTGIDIVQALIESMAFRFRLIHDILSQDVAIPSTIVASGGALENSKYLVKVMSDMLGLEVLVPESKQLTSRGTAVLALKYSGLWKSFDDVLPVIGHRVEPDMQVNEIYLDSMSQHKALYEMLI